MTILGGIVQRCTLVEVYLIQELLPVLQQQADDVMAVKKLTQ
jgi:hypothetical protein